MPDMECFLNTGGICKCILTWPARCGHGLWRELVVVSLPVEDEWPCDVL